MSKKDASLIGYGIDEEIDPNIKFNSLLSVTVSTVMCLAAGCPLPKSNVETTKLFLSTITDDNGGIPKNIKCFLSLLDDYSGPYEIESCNERDFEEKLIPEKEEKLSLENMETSKERTSCPEGLMLTKKLTKLNIKKNEKEHNKKTSKLLTTKCSISKSMISAKSNNRTDLLQ